MGPAVPDMLIWFRAEIVHCPGVVAAPLVHKRVGSANWDGAMEQWWIVITLHVSRNARQLEPEYLQKRCGGHLEKRENDKKPKRGDEWNKDIAIFLEKKIAA